MKRVATTKLICVGGTPAPAAIETISSRMRL